MIIELHPADELALIGEDIRRLKATLRIGFLRDALPKHGAVATGSSPQVLIAKSWCPFGARDRKVDF